MTQSLIPTTVALRGLQVAAFAKNVTFPYEPPTHPEKIYIEYTEDVPLGWSGDKYEIITDDKKRIEALRTKMQKKLDKAEEPSCT